MNRKLSCVLLMLMASIGTYLVWLAFRDKPISVILIEEFNLPGEGITTDLDFAGKKSEIVYWCREGDYMSDSLGPGTLGRVALGGGDVEILQESKYSYSGVVATSADEWIAITVGGELIASYSANQDFVLLESDSTFRSLTKGVHEIMFLATGRDVYAVRPPNKPTLYKQTTAPNSLATTPLTEDAIVLSSQGYVLLIDETANVFDFIDSKWLVTWSAYSPDMGLLAIGHHDETQIARPADFLGKTGIRRVPIGSNDGVWIQGTKYLILVGISGEVFIVDGKSGDYNRLIKAQHSMFLTDRVDAIAINGDGTRLAVARRSGRLSIYELTGLGVDVTGRSVDP